jgi:tetratricopeptide (TPR) repeat protein
VTLAAGVHRITFLHANSDVSSFAIAAMTLPGDNRHFVIGPEYFTRAAYAYVTPLVDASGTRQADFIWENTYMVRLRGYAGYDVHFEATALDGAGDAAYAWEFGDGTRGSGRVTNHLYFAEGEVPVTLTVTLPGGARRVCRQTLRIAPRYGQNENDDARALSLLNRAALQEREAGIQPQGYALITLGYFFFLKEAEAAAFGERVLAALDRIPEADLAPVLRELALGVQQVDEQYELAERCFRAILERVKDPKARASAALHFGGMLNLCLNRPQEAREVLNAIRREDLTDWEPRLLDIYLADTALVLDDLATAQKLYAAIPRQTPLQVGTALDKKALFTYNSRHFRVQNLLSQGLFRESLPEVDMLEWELPEERASPRINLMKVQALVGNGQPRKAIVCLQRALLAEVDETYTPKLRLELAKLYLGQRQFQQARHQIALIRKESPWTHEEIEARRLLDDIERALTEVTP